MADDIAEETAERVAEVAESIVDSAVAQVEGAVENAEARADAAEAALEAVTESARRDVLHDEIEDLREECETWRSEADRRSQEQSAMLTSMQAELSTLREQFMEATNKLTVLTVSTPPSSEATPAEQPGVTVTAATIEPENVKPAPVVAVREGRENPRRWI